MQIFLICFITGIAGQLIDGTLGMAYGVTCSTLLRAMGIPSAVSSFCVHAAEMCTTLVSGISHFRMNNIDRPLFFRLIIPGVVGGILGAYVLTSFDDRIVSPVVSAYLVGMGVVIFLKAFRKKAKEPKEIGKAVYPIALAGGFSDSIGGGGWGPVVTSTLVAADCDVRTTIGSVNAAEFFVTMAESAAFILTLGSVTEYLPAVGGLILGGVIVAPFSAYLCRKVPVKPLIAVLGVLIVAVNTWKFVTALMG